MRMQLLTSGLIAIAANGQNYTYDYGMPSSHKVDVGTEWSTATADIIADIQALQDAIEDDTGVRPTRAVCSSKTWGYIKKNDTIKKSIFVLSNGQATLSNARLNQYLQDELQLSVVVYSKRYIDEKGNKGAFVPDDTFVIFPEGNLGTTWFGTTPEESDLMAGSGVNVSIVDTGVAVTTIPKTDPVNVETKATQITLPSFETIDQIGILDVNP